MGLINSHQEAHDTIPRWEGGGGGALASIFPGYMPLATQDPYPIIDYIAVANKLKTQYELLNTLAWMFQLTFFEVVIQKWNVM